jgi:ATP-dependent RNA helicase DeaD
MTFTELGLKEEILTALSDLGFEVPTPIQQQAIPAIITGDTDLVGLAQTGTGKTAAFGLPLLSLCDPQDKKVQGLVLCPTRELCVQIAKDLDNFSTHLKGVKVVPIYGGSSIERQVKQIKGGAQIVVATPGRLVDMIKRRMIDLANVRYAVLDEADEMLNMGFKEDLDFILDKTPETKNTWLFSATMPRQVANIAKTFMYNPVEVTVGSKNSSASTIDHSYHFIHERNRYDALKRVLDVNPDIYGIIFCQTRNHTRDVADKLITDGYNADALHGDLSQDQRDYVMNKFRNKTLQVLVATDVAARGIDVDSITHVIHYQLPDDVENYTHRSGRTGRAGKEGKSIALVNRTFKHKLREIEKIINKPIEYKRIPEGTDICDVQLKAMVNQVVETPVNEDAISRYDETLAQAFASLTKEEVIKKFVSQNFERFMSYYANARDINQPVDGRDGGGRERGRETGRNRDEGFKRFFVNIGRDGGMDPGSLIRLICDNTSASGNDIGRIDLKSEFSFFQIKDEYVADVMQGIQGMEYRGERLNIEESKDQAPEKRDRGGRSGGGRDRDRGGDRGRSRGGDRERSFGGRSRSESSRGGERRPRTRTGSEGGGRSEDSGKRSFNRRGFRNK